MECLMVCWTTASSAARQCCCYRKVWRRDYLSLCSKWSKWL